MIEKNMCKIKEYIDFNFIIREKHQEIHKDKNITKNWYTGYISLLNLTINNGSSDISLIYNEKIHKYINDIKINSKNNSRYLNDISYSHITNTESQNCFVKINFYENGETKNIFLPENFDISNMVYINKLIKFIILKLSKNLYSENINEQIDTIDKSFDQVDVGEKEEEEEQNDYNDEQENELENLEEMGTDVDDDNKNDDYEDYNDGPNDIDSNIFRRNAENNIDISEEIENTYENMNNNPSSDSNKYHIKGYYENKVYSNITDFELERLEGTQARLEGSKLRKIKSSLIDEKGMLYYIIENENITIIQPNKDSLSYLKVKYIMKIIIYQEMMKKISPGKILLLIYQILISKI